MILFFAVQKSIEIKLFMVTVFVNNKLNIVMKKINSGLIILNKFIFDMKVINRLTFFRE